MSVIVRFKSLSNHLVLIMDMQINPKLLHIYRTVPGYEKVIEYVRSGLGSFEGELRHRGLGTVNTSIVHTGDVVEVQSFFVYIPSLGITDSEKEMRLKSYLVGGAHFFDDHVDNPQLNVHLEEMKERRGKIGGILDCMGKVGEVADFMAKTTTDNSDGVYKALNRMVYGGLIQFAEDPIEQGMYFEEHKGLATRGLDSQFVGDVARIRPLAYWLTTKTILEMFFAAETEKSNPTQSEAWNLVYSPAFYSMNAPEEEAHEGMRFLGDEAPKTDEMREMIDIGTSHVLNMRDARLPKRVIQLQFMKESFRPVLGELYEDYGRAHKRLKQAC